MRLLRRDGARNVSFTEDINDADLFKYPYAILSHTWGPDADEVTFDDIANETGASKKGYDKIRFCIRQTSKDDLRYFWIDTCCIDKKNSTELSKALISMFRWYSKAERCYVFLSDVLYESQPARDWKQDFRASRWFKRGWTLQELIAPPSLEFFANDGRSLGTKTELERLVNEVTHIPVDALRGRDLAGFTINERRQWQEGRMTREPEDMVYSLLGLVNISMPVLYGEGRAKAEQRLENEIYFNQRGVRHQDFSLVFSLAGAPVETQQFIARQRELHAIHENLRGHGTRKVVVLHGLGGIGKTQLAMAYAKRYRHSYSSIIWLNCKDEESTKSSFSKIARRIVREHRSAVRLFSVDANQDFGQVIDATKAWLSAPANNRWLLVCDNYDNPKMADNTDSTAFDIRHYLPEAYQGSILVTTRSSEVKLGHLIQINKLASVEHGLAIMENLSGRVNLANDVEAVALAKELDGLPLALATAGAYLSQSTVTFGEYLTSLKQSWAELQIQSPDLMTYENRTLYSTWQVSYEQIKLRNPSSAHLLHLWAYFDNQDLWYELLNHHTDASPEWMREMTSSRIVFEACMKVLCNHGLVEKNTLDARGIESAGYSVHPCVHAWMLAVLDAGYDDIHASAAVFCTSSHIPDERQQDSTLVLRRLVNHVNRCREFLGRMNYKPGFPEACYSFAYLYRRRDKMEDAEHLFEQALQGWDTVSGSDHGFALLAALHLGDLYYEQGRVIEAEHHLSRALEGFQNVPRLNPAYKTTSSSTLGRIYVHSGRYDAAERLLVKTLDEIAVTLGPDHEEILNPAGALVDLYNTQCRFSESEDTCLRRLKVAEKSYGPHHTITVQCLADLGLAYCMLEKLDEAEMTLTQALSISEATFGLDHSQTLGHLISLGLVHAGQGRHADAERMYSRALNGSERSLGSVHRQTVAAQCALASSYLLRDELEKARHLLQRARSAGEYMSMDMLDQINEIEKWWIRRVEETEAIRGEPSSSVDPHNIITGRKLAHGDDALRRTWRKLKRHIYH